MLISLQGIHRKLKVRRHRSCDCDSIDSWIGEQLVGALGKASRRISALRLGETIRAQVADADERRARRFSEIAYQVWPPVSVTDHTYSDHKTSRSQKSEVGRQKSEGR